MLYIKIHEEMQLQSYVLTLPTSTVGRNRENKTHRWRWGPVGRSKTALVQGLAVGLAGEKRRNPGSQKADGNNFKPLSLLKRNLLSGIPKTWASDLGAKHG